MHRIYIRTICWAATATEVRNPSLACQQLVYRLSPDVQSVANGVLWCVGARTYGSAFRRRWSQNQRAALPRRLADSKHDARHQTLLRFLHISAGWSTSSPRAKDGNLLICETLDFIFPSLWPLNNPDLNPVDYAVRSVPALGVTDFSTSSHFYL